jgi:hypothetical protein
MKLNQLKWIDDDNVCQCDTPLTNSTMSTRCHENYKVGVEGHGSALMTHENLHLSHNNIQSHPLPIICVLSPTRHIVKKVDPHMIQRLSTNAMGHPQKQKSLTWLFLALPISGTAKLNLWNAIPSVNMRQACRGTKSELKIKHRANEYTCILHVVEECKIRLWRY